MKKRRKRQKRLPPPTPVLEFSEQEKEVWRSLALGIRIPEIAARMHLPEAEVYETIFRTSTHKLHIPQTFSTMDEAIRWLRHQGVI